MRPPTTSTSRSGPTTTFLSADGKLTPGRKDQPPADLRYFKPAAK